MYKRGNSWYSDFWFKGERFVESHGPVSKTRAKEKDQKLRSDVASGYYIKAKNDPIFEKAIDEHLKKCQTENQPSTYRRNVNVVKHLKNFFGNIRCRSIESNEVLMRKYVKTRKEQIRDRQLKQGREEHEITYTTINRELAIMRAMFNVLIKAGKAKNNPVSLVTFFEDIQKERIITPHELSEIMNALDAADVRYRHLKDMIIIALNTAMRQGEILRIEKKWIDLRNGFINVPRYAMKRKKKDKRVPINSAVRPIIDRLMRQNPDSQYFYLSILRQKPDIQRLRMAGTVF